MIWALIPSWLKYSIAASLAAFLLVAGAYQYGKHEARQDAAIEAAKATAKAIDNRAKTDEKINGLDVRGLCLELGGSVSDCNAIELRGMETDRP